MPGPIAGLEQKATKGTKSRAYPGGLLLPAKRILVVVAHAPLCDFL